MGFLFGDLAFGELERCLGAYPVDLSGAWTPPEYWDDADIALEMADHPDIWTHGSRVYLPASEVAFDSSVWGTAEEYGDARLERCRAFMPVPGMLQTSTCRVLGYYYCHAWPCHLGIDNLDVARTIGRLLDRDCLAKPLRLVKDGDLAALAQCMIRARGRGTVRVTKVKGHATDADVEQSRVRMQDQFGNAEADAAADLGRRHQSELLINAGRVLLKVRNHWYHIMLQLHRFMIAIARVTVNHDGRGGTAPDPLVWDQRGQKKMRRTDIRVTVDLAFLPGPTGFLNGPWLGRISGADIAAWPRTLHWPVVVRTWVILGVLFGIF